MAERLVNQPTAKPTRKVGRGMLAAAGFLALMVALIILVPDRIPADLQTAAWAGVASLVIFAVQYITKERA